uniref:Putative secreted protein n=1 Tax=Panstrongylus lignarius TaxID=156445 RepID=A0A224XWZ7_9HEMI
MHLVLSLLMTMFRLISSSAHIFKFSWSLSSLSATNTRSSANASAENLIGCSFQYPKCIGRVLLLHSLITSSRRAIK